MATEIEIYLTNDESISGHSNFVLESIVYEGNVLYEFDPENQIQLGSSYDFTLKIYKNQQDPEFKHTVIVSQEESDDTIKPGGRLPGDNSVHLAS